jgi:hypothetical protein
MIGSWQAIGPVVGGLLAATAGFGAQVLGIRLQKRKEKEDWKNRVIRLCKRLDFEKESLDSQIEAEYRYTDVQPLLEDELASAPFSPPERVYEVYEEEIYPVKYIFQVGAKATTHRPDEEDISELSDAAREIIDLLNNSESVE